MAMPMNPEIKARWTAALRSGEYPQATGYLRNEEGYCCLGVLCELAVQDGVIEAPVKVSPMFGEPHWEYGPCASEIVLPYAVQDWAGLNKANPPIDPEGFEVTWDQDPESDSDDGSYLIANANDGRTSFTVIADIIDAQF